MGTDSLATGVASTVQLRGRGDIRCCSRWLAGRSGTQGKENEVEVRARDLRQCRAGLVEVHRVRGGPGGGLHSLRGDRRESTERRRQESIELWTYENTPRSVQDGL